MGLFTRTSQGGRKPRRFLPALEALEGRYAPSASAPFPVHHAHHQPRVSKDLASLLGSIFGGSQVQSAINNLTPQNNTQAQSEVAMLEIQVFLQQEQFTLQQLLQQQQQAVQQLLQQQQILLPMQMQQSSPQAQQQLIQQEQAALQALEQQQQAALQALEQQQQTALKQFAQEVLLGSFPLPPGEVATTPGVGGGTVRHHGGSKTHTHHLGQSSGTSGMVP